MYERKAGGTAIGVAVLEKIVLGRTHSPDCEDHETSEHMVSRACGVVVSHRFACGGPWVQSPASPSMQHLDSAMGNMSCAAGLPRVTSLTSLYAVLRTHFRI